MSVERRQSASNSTLSVVEWILHESHSRPGNTRNTTSVSARVRYVCRPSRRAQSGTSWGHAPCDAPVLGPTASAVKASFRRPARSLTPTLLSHNLLEPHGLMQVKLCSKRRLSEKNLGRMPVPKGAELLVSKRCFWVLDHWSDIWRLTKL